MDYYKVLYGSDSMYVENTRSRCDKTLGPLWYVLYDYITPYIDNRYLFI